MDRQQIDTNPNDLAQWSSFWRQGFITTFGASQPNNYDGVVREFWREKFIDLPTGARILDIATGNGAIATMAAEVGDQRQKDFFIAATDLAAINSTIVGDTEAARLRDSICFHSHTPCEEQPFEDDSFDLVSSQFGFEYSNVELTLREVRRVLMPPAGRFIAISHHANSALIEAAKVELDIYQYALEELDLFGILRAYFGALGNLSGSPKKVAKAMKRAEPLSQSVNSGVETFRQRHPEDECSREIVSAISYLARGARQSTQAERLAAVDAAANDFRFAQARLQDMIAAALNQEQIDSLGLTARAAGFESVFCLRLFGEDRGLVGWQIHMR